MYRLAVATFLIAVLQSHSYLCAMQAREPSERLTATQTATLVRSVVETILREHIDPPTRQQMVLAFARAFATKQGRSSSLELSPTLSDANGADEVYTVLLNELNKSKDTSIPMAAILETMQGGLGSMLGGLSFESRKNVQAEEQVAANRYVGIGVVLSAADVEKGMQFTKILEGGPASDGGIIDMDFLDAVDGKLTKDRSIGEVIQLLRGPIDTVVKVTVRTGAEPERELNLVRRVVPLKSLELTETNVDKKALLIRVDRFSASSINELQSLVEKAEKGGVEINTIVLDMQSTIVDNLHYFHLFADGILDDTNLCQIQTRKGIRSLKTEEGKALGEKQVSILFMPGHSEAIDLLSQSLRQVNSQTYFFFAESDRVMPSTASYVIRDSIEVPGTEFFIKTAKSRLLDADGQVVSSETLANWTDKENRVLNASAIIMEGKSVLDAIFNRASRIRPNNVQRKKP